MSQLSTNTTGLQAILAQVNALPDAGGGGGDASVETCTVSLFDGTGLYAVAYTTVDANGNVAAASVIPSGKAATITCLCGSVVAISHYRANSGLIRCTGSELLYTAEVQSNYGHSFIKLTCDAGETATFSTAAGSND